MDSKWRKKKKKSFNKLKHSCKLCRGRGEDWKLRENQA